MVKSLLLTSPLISVKSTASGLLPLPISFLNVAISWSLTTTTPNVLPTSSVTLSPLSFAIFITSSGLASVAKSKS